MKRKKKKTFKPEIACVGREQFAVMPGEPWALKKLKEGNEKYARLARDEELSLRQAGVTGWHAAQDARPGANAKAETAAQLLLVLGLSPLFMVSTSPALAMFLSASLLAGLHCAAAPRHPTLLNSCLTHNPSSSLTCSFFASSQPWLPAFRMEGDLKTASEELVKVRRERLRALYAADKVSWQEQLAARGLTMETF